MKNCWGKTILSVYRYLEIIAGAIDKLVETRALYSRHQNSSNYSSSNVFHTCEKITELTDKKVLLINLKILCEKALFAIDRKYARVLTAKYVDERRSSQSAELFGVCSRTYFRYVALAEDCFEKELAKMGYDSVRLREECKDEVWIMNVYNQLISSKGDDIVVLDKKALDRVYSSYRAVSL